MADGASQSQQSVAFVEEVTRGTTPTTPGYTRLRIREGTTFEVNKEFAQSTEIRSDREPGARVGGVAGWQGTITSFLVREAFLETLLGSTLSGTFATVTHSAVSVAFNSGAKTATRSTGSWLTDAPANKFEVGDLLFAAGTAANQTQLNEAGNITDSQTSITVDTVDATTVANATGFIKIDNEIISYTGRTATTFTGLTRGALGTTAATHLDNAPVLIGRTISAISATVLTFVTATVATESAVSTTFTTNSRVLVPGTDRLFGTFEQEFGDINLFEIFKGGEVNTANFTLPTTGEVTIDFEVLGTQYATGQVAGSTYTEPNGLTPFAASTNGAEVLVDSSVPGTCITNVSFTVNNNRARKNGVGEQFACFVEEGKREVEVTLSLYLVDGTFQTYFQNETRFRLHVTCVSADGDYFHFIFPRLLITALPRQVDGETFVEAATCSAERDATAGTAFYVRSLRLA
jgi:hypothetical protein